MQNLQNQKPLISLIVRTMNRLELPEALACIAGQTYPNIEVIVVDAQGKTPLDLDKFCGKFPLRIISKYRHLNIPEAANAGLDDVKGEFFGFLDEDDLIEKNHVEDLFLILNDSDAVAAYSNIKMVDHDGKFLRFFNEDYSHESLIFENYIPIHALLIKTQVLEKGCRSDESLEIYDDWDLLLQISSHGIFLHLDKITGTYRNFLTSGVHHNEKLIIQYRKKVFAKWKDKISPELYYSFINYLFSKNSQKNIEVERKYKEEHQKNLQLNVDLKQLLETNKSIDAELKQALNIKESIELSVSWRLTAPFRRISEYLRS